MTISTTLLGIVAFIYLLAFLLYVLDMVRRAGFWGDAAITTAAVGFTIQTIAIALRWEESYSLGFGHAPLANLYESLVFFAWTVVLFHFLIEWRTRSRSPGVFTMPVSFFLIAYASFHPGVDSSIRPVVPALQSNWLVCHVVACFFGYAAFTIACGVSLMLILKERVGQDDGNSFLSLLPGSGFLDETIYRSAFLGFILFGLGIVSGSVWAYNAWGSYWSWEPKEVWSLITWLIYATMLHLRFVHGWKGKRTAWVALVGFASVLFTYLGVNYLPGLHSYLH